MLRDILPFFFNCDGLHARSFFVGGAGKTTNGKNSDAVCIFIDGPNRYNKVG